MLLLLVQIVSNMFVYVLLPVSICLKEAASPCWNRVCLEKRMVIEGVQKTLLCSTTLPRLTNDPTHSTNIIRSLSKQGDEIKGEECGWRNLCQPLARLVCRNPPGEAHGKWGRDLIVGQRWRRCDSWPFTSVRATKFSTLQVKMDFVSRELGNYVHHSGIFPRGRAILQTKLLFLPKRVLHSQLQM